MEPDHADGNGQCGVFVYNQAFATKRATIATIKAVVRNGRIETDEPLRLPDGTELLIPVPERSGDETDTWDDSPDGIADWLAWADSLEPLIFTDAERATWEAEQQARKDWEKAHFDEYAANLPRACE